MKKKKKKKLTFEFYNFHATCREEKHFLLQNCVMSKNNRNFQNAGNMKNLTHEGIKNRCQDPSTIIHRIYC